MNIDVTTIDLRFGRFRVAGASFTIPFNGKRHRMVVVKCECGRIRVLRLSSLRCGDTTSCGCLVSEGVTKRNKKASGIGSPSFRHGKSMSRIYRIWKDMRRRCANVEREDYAIYGARGVAVCAEWGDFKAFELWALANGYAENLEIDRRENGQGYSPENCRWVTRKENCRNLRKNVRVHAFGETKCVSEWAEDPRCCVNHKTLGDRLRRHWEPERAITTSV